MQDKSTSTPTPRPRRQIEYRYFLVGREVSQEDFLAELARQGGRTQIEVFEIGGAEEARYRPTPAGEEALTVDPALVHEVRP